MPFYPTADPTETGSPFMPELRHALSGTIDSIGATSTDGWMLQNTTVATVGAQQWSPRFRFTGQGFAITPDESQPVDFTLELVPVQGLLNPSSYLSISSQVNGLGYGEVLRLTSAGQIQSGFGDSQTVYNATVGQLLTIGKGTAASPDTNVNPVIKVNRLIEIALPAIGGDGAEQLAGIVSNVAGTALNGVQPVGIFGGAISNGAYDAAGAYFVGVANSTFSGIGANIYGRKNAAGATCGGMQLGSLNVSGVDDTYSSLDYNDSQGMWIHSFGNRSAVGILFGNPFSARFDVGIAFNADNGGSIQTSSVRDDSSSVTSLDIRGTHTYAMVSGPTAGKVGGV